MAIGKDEVVATIGFRKNCQHGNCHPRILKFRCMCTTSDVCPHCLIKKFDELLGPRNFFFGSSKGLAVLESRFRESLRRVGQNFGVVGTTPHSCRITGARHWNSVGITEGTIARMGDWKSVHILRQYLGLSALTADLVREIRNGSQPSRRSATTAGGLTIPPQVEAPPLPVKSTGAGIMPFAGFAIATRRLPRHWHHCVPSGPSRHWWLACGVSYNASTMDIQLWSERQTDEKMCDKCCRHVQLLNSAHVAPRNSLSGLVAMD